MLLGYLPTEINRAYLCIIMIMIPMIKWIEIEPKLKRNCVTRKMKKHTKI